MKLQVDQVRRCPIRDRTGMGPGILNRRTLLTAVQMGADLRAALATVDEVGYIVSTYSLADRDRLSHLLPSFLPAFPLCLSRSS